jgi:hypothetical protein
MKWNGWKWELLSPFQKSPKLVYYKTIKTPNSGMVGTRAPISLPEVT